MEDKPLFKETRVPQQIVSVVPMLTTKALDAENFHNDENDEEKIEKQPNICSLCHAPIVSPTYYEVDNKYLHEYCYQSIVGPHCHCCAQPLCGKECIKALGKIYHMKCLRCSICQQNISSNERIESIKGLPVCHSCFCRRCKACPSCKKIVLRGGLRFLFEGQMIHMHKECAVCHECGKMLSQNNFAYEQGEVLCRNCWTSLADFVCNECGEVILSSERVSYNGYRHAKCFKCYNCGVNLIKSDPHIIGDLLLCKRCYSGINTHCGICFDQIEGDEKIEKFGRVFHPKCYKCCKCKKSLHNIESEFKKGKLICLKCLALNR